jgi:hypothetical protein
MAELYSSRPTARKLARQLLEERTGATSYQFLNWNGKNDQDYYYYGATPRQRMAVINDKDEFFQDIFAAFHDMKLLTNWNVEMFDVHAANQRCRQHESICDSSVSSSPSEVPK